MMAKPTGKAVKFILIFRLMLGLMLLVSLWLGGCANSNQLSWRTAQAFGSDVLPLVKQAVAENTQLDAQEMSERLVLASVALEAGRKLWFLDYHVADICGIKGCLYSVYYSIRPSLLASFSSARTKKYSVDLLF